MTKNRLAWPKLRGPERVDDEWGQNEEHHVRAKKPSVTETVSSLLVEVVNVQKMTPGPLFTLESLFEIC